MKGFYRGFGATIITYMPASGVWWFTYETLKPILYPFRPTEKWSGKEYGRNYYCEILGGMAAGTITTTLFNPLEIVKTRLQTQVYTQSGTKLYKNTFQGLKLLIEEEGLSSLTKGLAARIISRLPLMGFFALVYEAILDFSKKKKKGDI